MVKRKRHIRHPDYLRRLRELLAFPRVVEAMPDAVLITDRDARICYVNPAWEKLTGYMLSEMRGKDPRILNSAKTPPHVHQRLWDALSAGQPFSTDEIIDRRKDGSEYQIYSTFFPIKKDDISIFYVQMQHDITQRAAYLREVEANAELYRRLIDDASDGIFLLDTAGRIVGANKAICFMLGYAPEELIGQNVALVADAQDAAPVPAPLGELIAKKALLTERVFRTKSGRSIAVELNNKLIGSRFIQSIVRDITHKKELEKQRAAFVGLVAHELRTPLMVLKNDAELMNLARSSKDERPALKAIAASLADQISRLSLLVDDLLNVNRLQSGEVQLALEPIDAASFAREVINDLERIAKSHVLSFAGSASLTVQIDRARMRQVLENLVTNAIKYSPAGARVEVTVRRAGEEALFAVRDEGMGIDPAEQQRIFNLSYRTADTGVQALPGYGFGLYIAAQIVSQHGGRIWVESAKGKGSTFFVALPLAKGRSGGERA